MHLSRDKLQQTRNYANIVAMSDVKTRLGVIVGTNTAKFALMIAENRRTIDNYLKGRMPRREFLKRLAERTNININWLLAGKGPKEL